VQTIPAAGNLALTHIPTNPVRTGYFFFGWLETTPAGNQTYWASNAAFVTHINEETRGNITYTAQWRPARTITFNLNQGTIGTNTANVVRTIQGTANTAPTFGITQDTIPVNPTRAGYNFMGWLQTTPTGTPTYWERGDSFVSHIRNTLGNVTYTAQWSDVRLITFDLAGGNINTDIANVVHRIPYASNVAPNFGIVLNDIPQDPVRSGWEFTGWQETTPTGNTTLRQRDAAFVTYIRGTQGNRTFTAQWEEGRIPVSGDHRAFLVGFPDNTMRPGADLTRAEAATIFFRLIEDDYRASPSVWSTTNSFADVHTSNWFNNAVSTMTRLNVVNGVTADTYAPNRSLTNGEFFAMLARFNRLIDSNTVVQSNTGAHWASTYAAALEQRNLIEGFSTNATRLNAPISRAAVAELINRAITERVVENRDHLINNSTLRRNWSDLPTTSPHYLNMIKAGHTVEYDVINTNTAGDWNGVRWTRILRHIDWTVLEGPNANPRAILTAVEAQQAETAQVERNEVVQYTLNTAPSL
jgi:uncharacterized repeat protein (TIGR02543 family)